MNVKYTDIPNSTSRLYRAWQKMRSRCTNEDNPDYIFYGDRGITFDPKWSAFAGFCEDMLAGYMEGLTLERRDNNGNYCLTNCEWVSRKTQANNRRSNRFFEIAGKRQTLAQWIDDSGLKGSTVRQRVNVYKWPIEKAIGMTNV